MCNHIVVYTYSCAKKNQFIAFLRLYMCTQPVSVDSVYRYRYTYTHTGILRTHIFRMNIVKSSTCCSQSIRTYRRIAFILAPRVAWIFMKTIDGDR